MTELLIAETGSFDIDDVSQISEYRLKHAERYAREADRQHCIAASKALDALLKRRRYAEKDMRYRFTAKGKPEFENCPLHFNLSHSGNYICAVLSDAEVGVDVQQIVPCAPKVAERCFDEEERKLLELAKDRDFEFTRLWAKRESAVKLSGEGIAKMRETDISGLFFKEYRLEDHCICVCMYNEEEITLCQNV